MGKHRITNQKDLRRAFWEESALQRRKIGRGADRDYPTDTRVAFVDYVDGMQKSGQISEDLAQRVTLGGVEGAMKGMGEGSMVNLGEGSMVNLGGFGEEKALTFAEAQPALIGGGSAAVVVAAVRGLAPAGTWLTRHAGVVGAFAGTVVALMTKQGGAGMAAAVLVGGAVEGIEYLTKLRMTLTE